MPVENVINTHVDPGHGRAYILANGVIVMHGPDLASIIEDADRCMVDCDGVDGRIFIRAVTDGEREGSYYNPPVHWKADRSLARIAISEALALAGVSWTPGKLIELENATVRGRPGFIIQ